MKNVIERVRLRNMKPCLSEGIFINIRFIDPCIGKIIKKVCIHFFFTQLALKLLIMFYIRIDKIKNLHRFIGEFFNI